ncbi:MAG: hypothetical protein LBE67_16845 [Kocuria palustris]|jgi:hypothetical protein|uniref:hypothetical protein n=1 Tax=Kocuria palustris TaxID=71999 RepID=UPI001DC6710F|nr:hypothetical protein [Kocuria palustris]MBZ6376590.1 hypothetical protein [Kocuria palustris]
MTWAKYGTEFFDQLVDAAFTSELDDACQLTHAQAIHYIYSVESMTLSFPKRALRRFATSTRAEDAAAELVRRGLWIDHGATYEVAHHEGVIRQSLGYQIKERDRSRKAKATKRAQAPAATHVPQDVTRDGMRPQTDSQTDNHSYDEGRSSAVDSDQQTTVQWQTRTPGAATPSLAVGMSECAEPGCVKVVESEFCTYHADQRAGQMRAEWRTA